MAVSTNQSKGIGYTQHVVAVMVLCAYIALVGVLCWHSVPPENKEPLEIVLGVMGTAFGGVIGYYFGSTSASREKDQTISNLATAPATTEGTKV